MKVWTVEKLLELTVQNGNCLEWTRCLNSDGYPRIGPNVKVHRLMYELYTRENIVGKIVMHSCDNIKCINPKHLTAGTFADNNRDRMIKDRSYRTVKEEHVTKVNDLPEELSNREVAKLVGIDERRVSEIRLGRRGPDGRLNKRRQPQEV